MLDNLVYGHSAAVPPGVAAYDENLAAKKAVEKILRAEKIELVMHFAAYCYVGESVTDPLKYYLNNVAATLQLLKAMADAGSDKIRLLLDVRDLWGAGPDCPSSNPGRKHRSSPRADQAGCGKRAAVGGIGACSLSFASFRYFNAAGWPEDGSIGEDHDPETHLIPLAVDAATGRRSHLDLFGTDYPTPGRHLLARLRPRGRSQQHPHRRLSRTWPRPAPPSSTTWAPADPRRTGEVIRAVEK